MNKKLIMGIAILFVIGITFAIQAGTIFTPEQFINANIEAYDFEMTNEGWTTTEDNFVLKVGAITAKKVLQENGDWNGTIETIQIYKDYLYSKKRYSNCRDRIDPFKVITQVDANGEIYTETEYSSTKEDCQLKAKLNLKQRIIYNREKERTKLLNWQNEAINLIEDYDSEWNTPPTITNEELN